MSSYRSEQDILAILDLTIDSCLTLASLNMTDDEKNIIKRLNHWRENFKLEDQILHILEAPMSNIEFKDILKQILNPIIEDVLDHAKQDGVISPQEQKLLDTIIKNFDS